MKRWLPADPVRLWTKNAYNGAKRNGFPAHPYATAVHRLTFEIEHEGCWASEASARFPGAAIVVRGSVPVSGRGRDLARVTSTDADEFEAFVTFLDAHPGVRSSVVLERNGPTGYLLVEGTPERSLIEVITAKEAFVLAPIVVEKGVEYWSVGAVSRTQAEKVFAAVQPLGQIRTHKITKESFPDVRLTVAQRRVLRAAIDSGYYEFPRRIQPAGLAKRLGLAKSTMLEHLRKAEAKVMLAQEGTL